MANLGLGTMGWWLDPLVREWLREDVGRGDWATEGVVGEEEQGGAVWVAKEEGVVAGLPIAQRVFQLLDPDLTFTALVAEGGRCDRGQPIGSMTGKLAALLTGERVALNVVMGLSGVATLTRRFVDAIEDLPTQFVDTRKTTPGLRRLEKYGSRVGGARNHRLGLDDGVMLKDNHIAAAGGIGAAIAKVRGKFPYPLTLEVETESLEQAQEAVRGGADLVMLDNMDVEAMAETVQWIRHANDRIKIEASGNVSLETIRAIAQTGVDYISSSAPVTRSPWLDLSMRLQSLPPDLDPDRS
ncbi:carboxylating nicotinate-nucleotide diphosphorylase [Prochlorothrix hollandica]|uniref:Probable nicotinate-nucleotide pyrophosphorylase [carboxylating] n=1 Tax=Prochlorothrix hollandica PCC 9006 = CALU 1027 TaxID=317619 RepID=A0A0M2PPF1_PROHO|nr:carboxylating nicotinate-nucleotide diphosphorylase [Prochlorothrix hollandica]KKI98455.1 nicotinate-nucleotide pyrophosphorylase [Prochlorothrix hollandica PCC 9006 = CALU 1027]